MVKRRNLIPSFDYELRYWQQGYPFVAGLDEVGRGAFAGPLVAAAVILPRTFSSTKKIKDSKLLSAKVRREQAEIIKKHALFYAIEEIPLSYINDHGVGKAGQQAFAKLVERSMYHVAQIGQKALFFLVDGFSVQGFDAQRQLAIVKGDQKSYSIAAASIIAKVYRDTIMESTGEQYAHYNFVQNKGYGTAEHRQAIKEHGLCNLHRTSFNLHKFL